MVCGLSGTRTELWICRLLPRRSPDDEEYQRPDDDCHDWNHQQRCKNQDQLPPANQTGQHGPDSSDHSNPLQKKRQGKVTRNLWIDYYESAAYGAQSIALREFRRFRAEQCSALRSHATRPTSTNPRPSLPPKCLPPPVAPGQWPLWSHSRALPRRASACCRSRP